MVDILQPPSSAVGGCLTSYRRFGCTFAFYSPFFTSGDNQKCLLTLLNVPWEDKPPELRTTLLNVGEDGEGGIWASPIFLGETGGRKPVSHPSGCKLSDSGQDPPRCWPEFPHPKGEVSGGSGWSLRTRLSSSPRLAREVWSAAPASCCGFTMRCKDTHLPGLPFPPGWRSWLSAELAAPAASRSRRVKGSGCHFPQPRPVTPLITARKSGAQEVGMRCPWV